MTERTFDFVVVGAGSAGCVVAEGLSVEHSVCLIEAGGSDRGLSVAIPAAFKKLFRTDRDWSFETEPEPGAANRRLYVPRGKMLGGSSSMNAMIYIRGRPSDYNRWVDMGADGWGWNDVLPVFIAMESNGRGGSEFHGADGPVRVEDLRSPNQLTRRFLEAAIERGHPANLDFNGPAQEGVGLYQVTQRRGRRWSAADAFIRRALSRPTLDVITGALCTRVIVDGGRATGVEYSSGSDLHRVRAEEEVILCAGSFGSPLLLELSGIGEPDHLRSLGLDVVAESHQVGRNLQDHPLVGVIHHSKLGGTLDDAETIRELSKWLFSRKGRLTSNVAEAGGFLKSSTEAVEPDLQFHFGPVFFADHGLTPFQGRAFSLGPLLLDPASRGSVHARSANPRDPPRIRGDHLSDPGEVEALVTGLELTRDILAARAFDDVRGEEILPGRGVASRKALARIVRERVELLYHPVGTCRMGREGEGVVDGHLNVHGVQSLRVADASVMPRIISGNTNAATLMIGARAVEMILGQGSKGSES